MDHVVMFINRQLYGPFALVIAALTLGCASKDEGQPSFILVSVDTTRADHLSSYGYDRSTTPFLDALARKGILFEQAATVSENTLISHASLFTGLFPTAHGTTYLDSGVALHQNYRTLAEDFRDAGYETAGFTSHAAWLNPDFQMDQGFETFVHGSDDGATILKQAREWLDARDPTRPFFLFIHLFDVHSEHKGRPYQALPKHDGRWTSDYAGPLSDWDEMPVSGSRFLEAVNQGKVTLTTEDAGHIRDQYDEGLASTDELLGVFLDELPEQDVANTYITITSDHGEEFLEHGKMMHATWFDGIMHVPLLLIPPPFRVGEFGVPRRVDSQVGLVDIRPTLLSLARLDEPAAYQGSNLTPWLRGDLADNPSGPAAFKDQALRWNGFKMIRGKGTGLLFDLAEDPGELNNVSDLPENERRVELMRQRLREIVAEGRKIREHVMAGDSEVKPRSDAERDAELDSLGYTGHREKKD